MKFIPLALPIALFAGLFYLWKEDSKAVTNDLYMAWDVINQMKSDITEMKGEKDEAAK